jgi:hypothetical protein
MLLRLLEPGRIPLRQLVKLLRYAPPRARDQFIMPMISSRWPGADFSWAIHGCSRSFACDAACVARLALNLFRRGEKTCPERVGSFVEPIEQIETRQTVTERK